MYLHLVTRKQPLEGSHFSIADDEPGRHKKTQPARSGYNIDISVYVWYPREK
jgi:hypothetical protein